MDWPNEYMRVIFSDEGLSTATIVFHYSGTIIEFEIQTVYSGVPVCLQLTDWEGFTLFVLGLYQMSITGLI